MKYLLLTFILGFMCWIISEVIEIIQSGYSAEVYYLTAGYHFFAGIGIWGIYRKQTPEKNRFNLISVSIASAGYLLLTLFPIQVLQSGLSMVEFVEVNPIYKLLGFIWFAGMTLFSVSIIRSGTFPKWTGAIMLAGTLMFTATPLLGWPVIWVNIMNILFAITVIYISTLALKHAPT